MLARTRRKVRTPTRPGESKFREPSLRRLACKDSPSREPSLRHSLAKGSPSASPMKHSPYKKKSRILNNMPGNCSPQKSPSCTPQKSEASRCPFSPPAYEECVEYSAAEIDEKVAAAKTAEVVAAAREVAEEVAAAKNVAEEVAAAKAAKEVAAAQKVAEEVATATKAAEEEAAAEEAAAKKAAEEAADEEAADEEAAAAKQEHSENQEMHCGPVDAEDVEQALADAKAAADKMAEMVTKLEAAAAANQAVVATNQARDQDFRRKMSSQEVVKPDSSEQECCSACSLQ